MVVAALSAGAAAADPWLGAFGLVSIVVFVITRRRDVGRDPARCRGGGVEMSLVPARWFLGVGAIGLTFTIFAAVAFSGVIDARSAAVQAVFFGPLLLLIGAVALIGGLPRVRLDPEGVSMRGPFGRTMWQLGWDEVGQVAPPSPSSDSDADLPVELGDDRWSRKTIHTVHLSHPLWVFIEWVEHYRDHPNDRSELAGQGGLDRAKRLHAQLEDPSVEPAWLPPPRRKVS